MSNAIAEPIEAKDKGGKPLTVGTVCIYLGGPSGDDRGDRVVVRAVKSREGHRKPQCRVDTDVGLSDDANEWRWTAWVDGDELVVI